MPSLGELTLDLKLNDKGYTQDLTKAKKLAESLANKPLETELILKTDKYLQAIKTAERARGSFDRIVTSEFRVNISGIEQALDLARKAQADFKGKTTAVFDADNSRFIQAAKEVRAEKKAIDKPVTIKIGVDIKGLFSAVNNANKSIARLVKPKAVELTAKDAQFRKTLITAERLKSGFKKPAES